jgi:nucleotide-binding universal stress UspA family protein
MYKDILVYVDGSKAAVAAVDAAVTLARRLAARLVALHVSPPPFVAADLGPGAIAEMIRWQEEREQELRAAADQLVISARARDGLPIDWRSASGEIVPTIEVHSRYADLVVIGRAAADDVDAVTAEYLPETLIMDSARPILIVPPGWKGPVGETVLVAWNRSREASRAVHDALPVLAKAKSVTIFEANPSADSTPRVIGAEIEDHLSRHGIKTTLETVAAKEQDIARTLLTRAAALGADLIVAGAYGHSRLREYVLGGVTRELLRDAPLPLLMSH